MKHNKPSSELEESYKDYYILLESNLLGDRLDIIKCLNTREHHTNIVKANGDEWWFAGSIKYCIDNKQMIPFSHIEFAKLHCQEQINSIINNVEIDSRDEHMQYSPSVNEKSIINAYPLSNIK